MCQTSIILILVMTFFTTDCMAQSDEVRKTYLLSDLGVLFKTPGAISKLDLEPIRLRMKVDSVRQEKVIPPEGQPYLQQCLVADYKFIESLPRYQQPAFSVAFSSDVETSLRRLGINEFEDHFADTTIEVVGQLQKVGTNRLNMASSLEYKLIVYCLGDIKAVYRRRLQPSKDNKTLPPKE